MFYEYALDPQIVATWGERKNYRFYIREFKFGKGRLVSRYPKKWFKKVYESSQGKSEMERKRLEGILQELRKNVMVRRENPRWDDKCNDWLKNAVLEHERFPFHAILAQVNPGNDNVITEDEIDDKHPLWDIPLNIPVRRKAEEMAKVISGLLYYSRWIRFIDPYISPARPEYKKSISTFLKILAGSRPVGPPYSIELHTKYRGASEEFLQQFYGKIVPNGLKVTLFLWQEREDGQKFHNRYILTDIGGVAFGHGLDEGRESEMDYVTRLAPELYDLCCKQFNDKSSIFDLAVDPLVLSKE